ncbi:TetR/AcrR family transcriptional regulator [Nocardia sp. NPDC057227]|uniref:TetR/AcrR family transcriptional regulator n=1 Tax=Nocardia sp. NPDC057227 TaxID=3346056 RepID=UPI00363B48CD
MLRTPMDLPASTPAGRRPAPTDRLRPGPGHSHPAGHRQRRDPARQQHSPAHGGEPAPPAERKQLRGTALRDRLVETAAELFYQHGVHAISVDELVRRTGTAKASVYRRFPTKNDLVLAVLHRHDTNFWARWDRIAAEHSDPRDELDAHLAGFQELAARAGYRGSAFVNIAAESGHAEVRQRCLDHDRELARRLRALTARLGVADGDRLAAHLHLAIVGAFAIAGLHPAGRPAGHLGALADSLLATPGAAVSA